MSFKICCENIMDITFLFFFLFLSQLYIQQTKIKWQITTYPPMVWLKFKLSIYSLKFNTYSPEDWPKFKLLTCDLKSHDVSVVVDSIWSYLI